MLRISVNLGQPISGPLVNENSGSASQTASAEKILTFDQLCDFPPEIGIQLGILSGDSAKQEFGLPDEFIEILCEKAKQFKTGLSYRSINDALPFWLENFLLAPKELSIKDKSHKDENGSGRDLLLGGLLVKESDPSPRDGCQETNSTTENLTELPLDILGVRLQYLLQHGNLELHRAGENKDEQGRRTIIVQERSGGAIYKLKTLYEDTESPKLEVYKKMNQSAEDIDDERQYQRLKFCAKEGIPYEPDLDPFKYYFFVKDGKIAGQAINKTPLYAAPAASSGTRFRALARGIVQQQMLRHRDLDEVDRQPGRGRSTRMHDAIDASINEDIEQKTGLKGLLAHGPENFNTQFPETCESVLFIVPCKDDVKLLLAQSWEAIQAIDYAIQTLPEMTVIAPENRAYNGKAGERPYFRDQKEQLSSEKKMPKGSGKTIEWNNRMAAERMHQLYVQLLASSSANMLSPPMDRSRRSSCESIQSSCPSWLDEQLQSLPLSPYRRPSNASSISSDSTADTLVAPEIPINS